MTEQEWWERNLRRERPRPPIRSLDPSVFTVPSGVQPIMEEPVAQQNPQMSAGGQMYNLQRGLPPTREAYKTQILPPQTPEMEDERWADEHIKPIFYDKGDPARPRTYQPELDAQNERALYINSQRNSRDSAARAKQRNSQPRIIQPIDDPNEPRFVDGIPTRGVIPPKPPQLFAHGGFLKKGETGIVGEGGNGDPTDDEIIYARPDGGVDITPLHQGIPEGEQYLRRPIPPIDAAQSQSPSGGRNGGFTPEVLQRMFDAEQEAKNRQYPAPRYHPNGIRVTAWDERGPDGDPIGGETSDIERSTLNPNYNPAYDTQRVPGGGAGIPVPPPIRAPLGHDGAGISQNDLSVPGGGAGLPVPPQIDAPAEDMPPRISQNDLDYNQLQSPPKKEKLWKDILYVAGQAAANIFDTRGDYQPIERLGETQKRRKDAAATQRIQVRNARQTFEQDSAYRKGQIKKFETDAANQTRDDNDRFVTNLTNSAIKRKHFSWDDLSQPQKDRLAQMGYTKGSIPEYDERVGKTLTFGDMVWQQDPKTGKWVDSGITHDPKLKATEYEVDETDDDGNVLRDADNRKITRTFVTTSKGAAALKEYANMRKAQMREARDKFNVGEVNDFTKINADGELRIKELNAKNQRDYDNGNANDIFEIAKSAAGLEGLGGNVRGAYAKLQAANEKIQTLGSIPPTTEIPDVTITREFLAAEKEFAAAASAFEQAIGKQRQGQAITAAIRAKTSARKKPEMQVWKKVEPAQVSGQSGGGGQQKFTEAQARGHYTSQGKSAAEIDALIAKGKSAGLIY